MQTLLITGCAGFIGQQFLTYMLERYPMVRIIGVDLLRYPAIGWAVPNHPRCEFVQGDICNEELMDTLIAKTDHIVHFAAETHVPRSMDDGISFFLTNVMGTQVITNAVAKHQKTIKKYIYISTSEVYGSALSPVMTEEHPLDPHSPYAASKAGADRLVSAYRISHGIPSVIVRPFNNYGPGQHIEKAIPRFISHVLTNTPILLHGDGSAERDWLHVHDHCHALERVLLAGDEVLGETLNLATGVSTSIKSIAEELLQVMGRQVPIECIEDRPGQVPRHTGSTEKAETLLGWKATTPLDQGLIDTVNWFIKNRERWEHQWEDRLVPLTTLSGKKSWY